MVHRVDVLSFDIGGTLIEVNNQVDLYQCLHEITGQDPIIIRSVILRMMMFNGSKEEFIYRLCELLNFDKFSMIEALLFQSQNSIRIKEGVCDTLMRLKARGYRLITLANVFCINLIDLPSIGLDHFEQSFYSCFMHLIKPNYSIFRQVEETMHIKSDQIVHIGDSIKADINGAYNANWGSILLTNNTQIEHQSNADYHIHRFQELLDIFE